MKDLIDSDHDPCKDPFIKVEAEIESGNAANESLAGSLKQRVGKQVAMYGPLDLRHRPLRSAGDPSGRRDLVDRECPRTAGRSTPERVCGCLEAVLVAIADGRRHEAATVGRAADHRALRDRIRSPDGAPMSVRYGENGSRSRTWTW